MTTVFLGGVTIVNFKVTSAVVSADGKMRFNLFKDLFWVTAIDDRNYFVSISSTLPQGHYSILCPCFPFNVALAMLQTGIITLCCKVFV